MLNKSCAAIIALTFGLTAYTANASSPKTVDYYLKNTEERKTLLKKCNNSPAEYKDDGDCINASYASRKARYMSKSEPIPFRSN